MNALTSSPMLSWVLSYVFNALWQIPLVFAAAWIAARMLRQANPRVGHRVWVAALLLEVVQPACNLPIGTLWSTLRNLIPGTANAAPAGGIRVLIGPATVSGGMLRLPGALEVGIALAYACTLLYFAARVAWGLIQTRALARSATRIPLTGEMALRWKQHCHRIGISHPSAEIASSPHAMGPVTVGLRRGLLLVPARFLETLPASDLDAVLAHELAHIARRDFAKNLFYGLLSLPVAWHPLLWRTRAHVAESRELICDAIAAAAIAPPGVAGRRQYAHSLLRLASMLTGRPTPAALHDVGILSFNADRSTFERRLMTLARKPAPMSTARRLATAAACCALALATCTSALALRTDVSAIASTTDTATPAKIHVKSGIMAGQKISGKNPTYPKEARTKKIQGAVVIDATISKDGAIENLRVTKSPDKLLSESAMEAVRTWRYRPYLLNGEPVEVETTINVVYNLAG